MKKTCSVISGLIGFIIVLFSIQSGNATTLDTHGTGAVINCTSTPFLEAHTVSAEGKTTFRFHGQCYYSQGESAWNKHYYINASWDGKEAKEVLTISGENKSGTVVSTCTMDPWLNKMSCQKKSLSGTAFSDYQITGATTYPLTGNVLTDEQRAQFMAELEQKKKDAACVNPVLVSPSVSGSHFNIPASIKVEVKHGPTVSPKDWTFSWAPTPKQGEWPTAPVKQNIIFNSLKTVNGVTTGILNTSKLGEWQIQWKIDFPAFCNKPTYAMSTKFTVKEKSQAEKMAEEALKNKQYKTIDGTIPGPKPGPGPDWQQKQIDQQLQQKQLQQQLQQKQNLK